jgi:nucleoside-diphosphate-sugar epimerase
VRVLLLGGTGLISTAITRLLLARGDAVTLLTRGRTAHGFGGRVREVHGDRGSTDDLVRAIDAAAPDAVVDMIGFTAADAERLVAAMAGRARRLVCCSTVDVHPKPAPALPVTESSPRGADPDFAYAVGKVEMERVLEAAAARGDLELTLLRPAATYATQAVAPVGTWSVMVDRLRRGEPVILPGDGTALWTSCHRDDVAAAFVAALDRPEAVGRAYVLAGDEPLTWNAYWGTVAHALGVVPRVLHVPTDLLARLAPEATAWCRLNFQHGAVYDSTAAARDLAFRSRRTWAEGVASFDLAAVPEPDARDAADYDALVRAWLQLETALVPIPSRKPEPIA